MSRKKWVSYVYAAGDSHGSLFFSQQLDSTPYHNTIKWAYSDISSFATGEVCPLLSVGRGFFWMLDLKTKQCEIQAYTATCRKSSC